MKKMVQGLMMLVATAASSRAFTGEVALSNPLAYSCTEMETFLLHAQPGGIKSLSTGVTTHVQTVNETKNFRDSYKYNIVASGLAKWFSGTAGSVSWWVNNTMMEAEQMYAVRVFQQLAARARPIHQ